MGAIVTSFALQKATFYLEAKSRIVQTPVIDFSPFHFSDVVATAADQNI